MTNIIALAALIRKPHSARPRPARQQNVLKDALENAPAPTLQGRHWRLDRRSSAPASASRRELLLYLRQVRQPWLAAPR